MAYISLLRTVIYHSIKICDKFSQNSIMNMKKTDFLKNEFVQKMKNEYFSKPIE